MRSVKIKGMKKFLVATAAAFMFTASTGNGVFAVDTWTDFKSGVEASGNQNVTITGPITAAPPVPANVTGNVTVNGAGYGISGSGLSAGNANAIINVNNGATYTVNGGTYESGYNNNGNGGFINSEGGTVNINSGTIFSNNGQSAAGDTTNRGGAIYNGIYNQTTGSTLTIGADGTAKDSVQFTDNIATQGGAIYNGVAEVLTDANNKTNFSTAIISNTTFSGNKAQPPTGDFNDGRGGAIFNNQYGQITIDNSSFENNEATTYGGAIFNEKGGQITINNSDFTANKGTDSAAHGGAIYNTDGTTTITNSTFTNNTATQGGAIYSTADGYAEFGNTNLNVSDSKFIGNEATASGMVGGGAVHSTSHSANFTNVEFTQNKASGAGGALFNHGETNAAATGTFTPVMNINGTTKFDANEAVNNGGGAIYNAGILNINTDTSVNSNVSFTGNTAGTDGGAIYNSNAGQLTIGNNAQFSGNRASNGSGGAIYTANGLSIVGVNDSENRRTTVFENNYASENGGAIYTAGSTQIENAEFRNNGKYTDTADNELTTKNGGALYVTGLTSDKTVNVVRNVFNNNTVSQSGGALYLNTATAGNTNNVIIDNNEFSNNAAKTGGAIYNNTASVDTIVTLKDNVFKGNTATQSGGAIYNDKNSVMSIKNAFFSGNEVTTSEDDATSSQGGGAIYNAGTMTITDSSFAGNKAVYGGAIYGAESSITNVFAESQDIVFGDATGSTDSIYLAGGTNNDIISIDSAKLNFNVANDRVININSNLQGERKASILPDVNINPLSGYEGTVKVNSNITDTNITLNRGMLQFIRDEYLTQSNILNLNGGTLNMLNGFVNPIGAGTINVLNDTKLLLDVDLKNQTMDSILKSNTPNVTVNPGAHLNVAGLNAISDATSTNVDVLFTDVDALVGNGTVTSEKDMVVKGPLYQYIVNQQHKTVNGVEGEYFSFVSDNGNGDPVFVPDSMIPAVAAQLGGFLMMDNIYRQAFSNMDMVMTMTRAEREALRMRNKYASADKRAVWAPAVIPEERDGFWFRPFSNFENVPLKNGPRVSNVFYGTLVGADSDLVYLGKGWDGTFSVYGAYTGSHQAFQGNSIWQNGGVLGASGIAYKGNFFSGLTVNVGGSGVEATSMFGRERFGMFMTGAAWKSGYNFGFFSDKLVLQPSYMMSYTFVNSSDYTNAAGLRITQDPLNAIEIIPGIKLIGNFGNGWQPYFGVNMVWNIIDKTHFYAQDVALPQLAVKPYVEYGPGLQKRYGDRFTGFGQAMFRSGGRNGVAFTLGARWAIGD